MSQCICSDISFPWSIFLGQPLTVDIQVSSEFQKNANGSGRHLSSVHTGTYKAQALFPNKL